MTLELYDRSWSLTVTKKTGFFTSDQLNQVKITQSRIVATVQKTLDPTPNKTEIRVYNLSDRTRASLEEKPLMLILEAGWGGVLARVAQGDVKSCRTTHKPPDIETVIQLGDGEKAYRHARMSRSFGPGVNVKTILSEVAGSMGLSVPKNSVDAQILAKTLVGGQVLEGPSSAQMTKILKSHGLGWSVQDGNLQIQSESQTRADQAILIASPPLGDMIGSPFFGDPKTEGGAPTLVVSCLLRPQVSPGCKIQVSSRRINGLFKVLTVKHSIDTHGAQNWHTEMEGRAL